MEPSRAPSQPPMGIQSQRICMVVLFETLSSDSILTSYLADSICIILVVAGLFLKQVKWLLWLLPTIFPVILYALLC